MTVSLDQASLVNWTVFGQARAELGANLIRILGYFEEDGVKSVSQIEEAMRAGNAAGLVLPAHTLKGEARQFGADPLADTAETIEVLARAAIEAHESPDGALEHVVRLRPLFEETLPLLQREAAPVVERRPAMGFGRRATGGFGVRS